MSLNVHITPDLDDEEEVEERTEDDEEEEFCNLASVRTRILPSLARFVSWLKNHSVRTSAEQVLRLSILYAATIWCTTHTSVWSHQSGHVNTARQKRENGGVYGIVLCRSPCNNDRACIAEATLIHLPMVSA